jgi:hypothetical protein
LSFYDILGKEYMGRIMAEYRYNCGGKRPRAFKEVKGDLNGEKVVIVGKKRECDFGSCTGRCDLNGGECWAGLLAEGKRFILENCNGVKPRYFKYILKNDSGKGVIIGVKLDSRCSDKQPGRRCDLNLDEECWTTKSFVTAAGNGEVDMVGDDESREDPFSVDNVMLSEE